MTLVSLQPSTADAAGVARVVLLDARFAHGGAFAGVEDLVEAAWIDLRARGRDDLLSRHDYALHMVLRRHRDAIPLSYASLTDLAEGVERTRNFPLDRAYRIVHGLIDLVLAWRALNEEAGAWIIVARGFDRAQHLATRFFHELARRGARAEIEVLTETAAGLERLDAGDGGSSPAPDWIVPLLDVPPPEHQPDAAAALIAAEPRLGASMALVDLHHPAILAYHRARGDDLAVAQMALRALCLFNHFGYYHEAGSFADEALARFDAIVGDDEDLRWNYLGNIFQGLVTTGRQREAQTVVETLAVPRLTRPDLRAKMHYVLSMIHLRYADEPDLARAEEHIEAARRDAVAAATLMDPAEHAFLTVFLDNGLAFLRVRQGRPQEALSLCQDGYELLTRELGEERHRLHRSVLQYNSAQVYTMLGEDEHALEHYRLSIEMDPHYSEYYNESANILQRQDRHDDALAAYSLAERYSAPYPELFHNRAVCQARLGDWEGALASLARSLDLDPRQPDALVLRAEVLGETGEDPAAALADLDVALALDDTLVTARVNRAVARYADGDYHGALADMDRVLTLESDEPDHYDNRAEIHLARGDVVAGARDRAQARALRSYITSAS